MSDALGGEPVRRPSLEELRAMKCPDCGGFPVEVARWATKPWQPGQFCSCPFDERHP